jgi:predicted phosphodiesterase
MLASLAALPGKAHAAPPLRFTVYGDSRDGHDAHRKIVALMIAQNPAFVLQTGDLVHNGTDAELWKIYDEITGPLRAKCPIYPAAGNHDAASQLYLAHVPETMAGTHPIYYSFDREGCHFISLAVDEFTAYDPGSKQYHWLIQDLEAARPTAKHIFVYFHVPPYSIGSHGSDLNVRQVLCPVFEKYKVSVVFTGHDHNYYRTIRNGIPYIVTGGGGAPLYPCYPAKGAIQGDVYKSVHNMVSCEVDGDHVNLTAFQEDGSVLDKFTVDR